MDEKRRAKINKLGHDLCEATAVPARKVDGSAVTEIIRELFELRGALPSRRPILKPQQRKRPVQPKNA